MSTVNTMFVRLGIKDRDFQDRESLACAIEDEVAWYLHEIAKVRDAKTEVSDELSVLRNLDLDVCTMRVLLDERKGEYVLVLRQCS